MSRRIITDEYNRIPSHEDIFAAGDYACAVDESGRPQSPTAHIAMVQGDLVAHNIYNTLQGSSLKKYKFERAGEIVTLGKTNAVGDLFGIKFTGSLAKFMKKVVHWWHLYSIGGARHVPEDRHDIRRPDVLGAAFQADEAHRAEPDELIVENLILEAQLHDLPGVERVVELPDRAGGRADAALEAGAELGGVELLGEPPQETGIRLVEIYDSPFAVHAYPSI